MDSDNLTPDQLEKLQKIIARDLRFYGNLALRMEHLGFAPQDPLMVTAWKARDALHSLHVLCHYASCRSAGYGVGPVPTKPEETKGP